MKEQNTNNRNYLAWREEMCRRGEVSRGLRFAVFVVWVAVLVALAWLGVCAAAPAFMEYQARVQEELDAEQEGLQAAYDAEALAELERELDNRKGDAE